MGTGWRVAGTSIAGPHHSKFGGECQDRHRAIVTEQGGLIALVSDGAGSAEYGGEGAAALCDALAERLEPFVERNPGCTRRALAGACRATTAGIEAARAKVGALGDARGAGIAAFHATLVGAVMLPGGGGLFFHIGDGAALAVASAARRWLMSPPCNGEYSHTTYFFTEADWRRNLRFSLIEPGYDTIFVMSDGVTDLGLAQKGHASEPHMPFFEPIGRFLASASREEGELALRATLDSEAARERTGDDKTLVWAQATR